MALPGGREEGGAGRRERGGRVHFRQRDPHTQLPGMELTNGTHALLSRRPWELTPDAAGPRVKGWGFQPLVTHTSHQHLLHSSR